MKTKFWTAAAVILAMSGGVVAGEMSGGGSANPAADKGVTTPKQPNETQPGSMSGTGAMKDGSRSDKAAAKGSAKGEMKGDAMSGGSGMKGSSSSSGSASGMSSGGSNIGNPAEKGPKTPAQPNETQPGSGSNKSK